MAGLLEYLIQSLGAQAQAVPGVTMPMPDDPATALDPAAEAELARVAAAGRVGRRRAPAAAPDAVDAPAGVDDRQMGLDALQGEAARTAAASRLGARRGAVDGAPVVPVESAALPAGAPMAGILGALGMPGVQPGGGFKSPYDEANPAGVAQEARDAAAGRMTGRRRTAFTGLNNGAVPFAGMLSDAGLLNAPGAGAVADAPVATAEAAAPPVPADLPPSTNDPMANEPQVFADGVPLPRPRPVSPATTGAAPLSLSPPADEVAIPPDAKVAGPAVRAAPAAAAPAAASAELPARGGGRLIEFGDGLLGKIFDPSRAGTMLALGAGFSGAPSFGTGMRRAFAGAAPAAAADRAASLKQEGVAQTYKALVARGVPAQEALAAVYNPDIMKATAAKYFETKPRVPHKIGTDMMGNDIMGSFDPNKGTFFDAAGNQIGGGSGGSTGLPNAGAGILAKGVTEYNSDLPADEYKAQFSPEVQAQMDAYARGDTQPTGNPRMKGLATKIKEWTQTWGSKAGVPVSDATFSERRKFLTELGSAGAGTAGGQVKAFNQGMEHADALAKKLEDLKNVDPVGVPAVAHGLNWMRQAFSTKQTGIAKEAAGIGQTLAGEVGKLFSGSAGGGVHERELTRQRFNTSTSPEELAGALEATVETMEGGLHALEGRRDSTLTPEQAAQRPFVTKQTQERIDRIRGTIKRMRGDEDAPPAAPAQILKPGASTVINGVTIKRLN